MSGVVALFRLLRGGLLTSRKALYMLSHFMSQQSHSRDRCYGRAAGPYAVIWDALYHQPIMVSRYLCPTEYGSSYGIIVLLVFRV